MLRKLLNTFLCLGLPLFAAVPAVAADAPTKRSITLDDLARIQRVSAPVLSPDGE
jgi:hypothetical protein